jgi:hypothetical protein
MPAEDFARLFIYWNIALAAASFVVIYGYFFIPKLKKTAEGWHLFLFTLDIGALAVYLLGYTIYNWWEFNPWVWLAILGGIPILLWHRVWLVYKAVVRPRIRERRKRRQERIAR